MKAPVGVILAGGQASRMGGGDKGRLMLGGQSLFSRVIARFAPQVGALAISANGDPARLDDLGLPVLADSVAGFPGPLAGVLAGMDWAAGLGAEQLVTVAADTPFLPCDLVPRLLLAAEGGAPVVLASSTEDGRILRHPTFGLWPVARREDLRGALAAGVRKVGQWADAQGVTLAPFPAEPFDPFLNINTPGDLARAEALLR